MNKKNNNLFRCSTFPYHPFISSIQIAIIAMNIQFKNVFFFCKAIFSIFELTDDLMQNNLKFQFQFEIKSIHAANEFKVLTAFL